MDSCSPHDGRIPHTCIYCQEELVEPKSQPSWSNSPATQARYDTTFTFKANGTKAQEAAANGCAFWAWFIKDFIDEDGTTRRNSEIDPNGVYFEATFTDYNDGTGYNQYPFQLRSAYMGRNHESGWSGHDSLNIVADEGDPAYKFIQPVSRTSIMGSEENFTLARKWMETCDESHDKCAKPEAGIAPTRLLEVDEATVRLRVTAPGESPRWAALSYCWGGPQPLQTTKDTLEERTKNIPISLLPKTIQDAITTTRNIDLQYLWVDCLCIVQDDPDDVSREIASMPEIYSNAAVTISAARANTSAEGFLQPVTVPSPQDNSFRLRFLCPDGQIGSVIFYGQDVLEPRRDPIEQRAWTLQEHLLSQRLLIFGSRQIWWTCKKVHTIHSGRSFSMYSEIGEIRLRFLNVSITQKRRYLNMIPGQTWLSLVQHYTDRTLTFSHDKLLAISGIAEFYAKKMDDQYYAGHFRSSLISSLLWKRFSPILPRPVEYRVPSWSWAAIDGRIRFELYRAPIAESLELLECKIELVSESAPYGAVKSGTLTLRGRIRKLLWSPSREQLINPKDDQPYFAETIPDATSLLLPSIPQTEPNLASTPVYCLEICSYTTESQFRWSFPGMEDEVFGRKRLFQRSGLPKGLLLESEDGETFRRVGLFAFRDVQDLRVGQEMRDDVEFKERIEKEKREFFEGCETSVVNII
ncbi:uncharacterized protein PAC_20094 [Phialocephala subalpina]|uniref:Heterokaryon incompatibility domain-containing protein n=1 Tax=Phialocephala subalpina TaxID=576137 RepID=A0A1L7XYP6_9HELO|nr:uncharacterized protein PAC_20094 [Phialocephala subalpina]